MWGLVVEELVCWPECGKAFEVPDKRNHLSLLQVCMGRQRGNTFLTLHKVLAKGVTFVVAKISPSVR